MKLLGVGISGTYYIDPDGPYSGSPPVEVFCDLKTGKIVEILKSTIRILFLNFRNYYA